MTIAAATALPDAIFADPRREPLRLRPLKAFGHFRKLVADKEDTEQVFHIFEALPRKGFVDDARAFCDSAIGRSRMISEPYLPAILDDHDSLEKLPAGSVGRTYLDFMRREGLSAAGLVAESDKMRRGRPVFDDQIQWYSNRLRDTHDLLHILTGYGRDPLGEASVLAFTYGQTGNYGNAFIAMLAGRQIRKASGGKAPIFAALRQGWRHGKAAPNLINEDIRSLLAEPIEAARARLNIGQPSWYRTCHDVFAEYRLDPHTALATV